MAKATGRVTPQQMEDMGQRADAAAIMREAVTPPAPAAFVPRRAQDADADPELAPFLQGVLDDLAGAMRRFGPGFTGAQAFGDATERQRVEASAWDDRYHEMPDDTARAILIARYRWLDAEYARDQRNAVLMRSQIASAR